ncbi:MAG: LysR family transcriptional regulator [Lachnospiraceae bacterium]
MTIRHLKIFITVADTGKMNAAAKILYISQPSVSQAIRELEDYYGIKLFERFSRKLYITDSGKQLLSYARHVVESFETMDIVMKNAGEHPKLRVGASVSVGTCLIGTIVEEVEQQQPGMNIQVVVDNTSRIEQMLQNSQLDIGIVEGVVSSVDFVQESLCKDELVVVVGKTHEFYQKKEITLGQLEGQSLIAREDGSLLRNQYERLLLEERITLEKKWSCTNTEAIKNAVIAGSGLTILSRMLVEKEVKEGTLYIVPVHGIKVEREMQLTYHHNKYLSGHLLKFIEISRQTMSKQ